MTSPTDTFEPLRPHLLGVAYRMLGTWSDAEDAVQSAWIRVRSRDVDEPIAHPRAWWTRVVVRQCLDVRAQTHRQRETYIGPWLPEPLGAACFEPLWSTASSPMEEQTLRLAMLRLMQLLTPLELAAFLLRDVFDDDYESIAETLGRNPPAIRQLVRRAREHMAASATRFSIDRDVHERMIATFAAAAAAGDVEAVRSLLHEHCVAYTDGGGKASAATKPVDGVERVARLFCGIARRVESDLVPVFTEVNGLPGLAFIDQHGRCDSLVFAVIMADRIIEIGTVRNPDKLGHVVELVARTPTRPPRDLP